MVEDVGLEAERRRYARVTQPTLEPSIKAEQRRQETYRREKQRTQEMVETVVREQQIPPGVYQVGDKYVAVVPPTGQPQVMYREQYQALTPEQMLQVGVISQEEYGKYQRGKERAFLEWERTVYPKWAVEYERYETLSGLITNINRLSMRVYGEWGLGEKGQPILLKPGLTYQLQELGLGVFELRAREDPYAAMRFAVKMGYISDIEYGKWVGEMWEYQKLWEEDPNKALSFALGKRWITPEQYRESYLTPTFPEYLETRASEFMRHLETGPVGFLFKPGTAYSYTLRGTIGVGIGITQAVDPFTRAIGVLVGAPWAYKVKPPRPGMMEVVSEPFFGPEGLQWPQWGGEEQRTFETYVKRVQEWPGMPVGEVGVYWVESKAVGWVLKQYGAGFRWLGGKIARTGPGIKILKTFEPPRIDVGEKVAGLKWHLPESIQKRLWPVEYGRRQIEKGITWGEKGWVWVPDVELAETLSKTWKYTGYPVIYGEKAGYKILKAGEQLTAFQQIQKAIELGKFKGMGGLSAQQLLLFEKPSTMMGWQQAQYLARVFAPAAARKATTWWTPLVAGGVMAGTRAFPQLVQPPLLKPIELEKMKFRHLEFLEPKMKEREKPIPILKPFELEKIKFRQLEFLEPKVKQREKLAPIPKLALTQAVKQMVRQVQAPIQMPKLVQKLEVPQLQMPKIDWTPWHPPPPPPPFLFDFKLPPEMRLPRGKGFWGGWFKRVHPIATPREVMQALGMAPARRVVKKVHRKTRRK